MKLVILAGGKGTRLGSQWVHLPKPMVPLAGRPILEHQLALAKRYGFEEVIILLGHMGGHIRSAFGNLWDGMRLTYLQEERPLGTAGAVRAAAHLLDDDFMVFYGDTIMDIDLSAFLKFRRAHSDALATLLVHPNDHPFDSDLLEESSGQVVAFHSKPHPENLCAPNLVNAALYILSPKVLEFIPDRCFSDFGKDIFPAMLKNGSYLTAYKTAEYIKDVGTVERLEQVEEDITSGKVSRLNKGNSRACIFLDRDGTINREVNTVRRREELVLLPGAADAIRSINRSEFLAVVVTNQPSVAKGFMTERDLADVHAHLEMELGRSHAYLDRIYYCPHHPEKGFEGEREELKIDCRCRKPGIELLERACRDLNIDLSRSWFIGDSTADVMAAYRAGVKSILLDTGYGGRDNKHDVSPDFKCASVREAVAEILHMANQKS